ncbi:MAG: fused MFS/spermidine synthase [Acidimicrobiia bacterium]|nr:fused MFS/spermidine synthase [Acidimicrobiia bacterium]
MRLRRPGTGWLLVFTTTLFLSSALLFAVQPMVAKMVLPLLGGAPATWITCMLFFQSALLAGYAYAHWSTQWLGSRRQAAGHLALVAVSLVALPVAVPRGWTPDSTASPVAWLLLLLIVSVGLPFFVASSTGPLLQRWFTSTPHASAQDPYFLYRASNLGSVLALLAYPVLMEPRLRLADQARLWAGAYVVLAVLTGVCALTRWRVPVAEPELGVVAAPLRLGTARRLRWVALAFVPSSLMLAVTTHVTTDIAPIPLLWVIPLGLYLLSFVVAFSPRPSILSALIKQAQPFLILQLLLVLTATRPLLLVVAANLAALFASALVCHGRLADDRPPSEHLTAFYLWIALGGALGGVFNAVVAPLLFDSVVEYPLAIVAACLLRPPNPDRAAKPNSHRLDYLLPLAVGAGYLGVAALTRAFGFSGQARPVALVTAVVVCAAFNSRPVRFGLAVGAVLLASALPLGSPNDTLYAERTFFGVLRVDRDQDRQLHLLVHGTTVHGAQSTDPARRLEPLTYYWPLGPLFVPPPGRAPTPKVAVIGLGTGSLACYGRPEQHWTFYEIDPAVERLARDPELFTYLRDCPPESDVVVGDARRSLSRPSGEEFGVIVVDAFTSDSIPVHLLTRQALDLYLDRLADGGIIAVNVSNRYLDLDLVLGDLAADADMAAMVRDEPEVTEAQADEGKAGSVWVAMAREPADLASLAADPTWVTLPPRPGADVWTDDFSNLLGAIRRE